MYSLQDFTAGVRGSVPELANAIFECTCVVAGAEIGSHGGIPLQAAQWAMERARPSSPNFFLRLVGAERVTRFVIESVSPEPLAPWQGEWKPFSFERFAHESRAQEEIRFWLDPGATGMSTRRVKEIETKRLREFFPREEVIQ